MSDELPVGGLPARIRSLRGLLLYGYVAVGVLLLTAVLPAPSGSVAGWFDDDGRVLYCIAFYDAPGAPPVELATQYWLRSERDLSFNCKHFHGDPQDYDAVTETVESRIGVTRIRLVNASPGCGTLVGGVADRIELTACAEQP